MSWHFLQEREEASWAENSLDGAPSALLNLLNIQGEFCSPDSAMDCSNDSRYGTTCEPLMESDGKAASMSSAAGFRAKTLAWPGKDWGWLANAPGFGVKCSGSFAKWNRDSYSWKTAQCSLLEDSAECLETWPRSGMTRNGVAYLRKPLEPNTKGKGYGLWPTPQASDNRDRGSWDDPSVQRRVTMGKQVGLTMIAQGTGKRESGLTAQTGNKGSLNPQFVCWLMGFPPEWCDYAPTETRSSRKSQ